ncbi:MAG: Na/Pi cotransporter family protein [Spirochaetes bacterium]|nr:Na/Pi cotransporter family protein [Spirochaetota bacterium]MBU1079715.1 Na/Pi cotransporter family protein [Spirochaetota bacterium]
MSVYDLFNLGGGLALFLFGMLRMNDNLTALAGDKLRSVMLMLTKNKFRGYLTGLGITIVNQSSSATTVLEAVLVGAGLMTFRQSLAVTLGAELGSTFLGQLFAFPKITKIATLFVALGFFAFLVAKNKRRKAVANAVLGFGLLFLGMDMMSGAMEPLRGSALFLDAMARIEVPILGILVGLLFTMVVQSSGATTGLVIAMALSGTITLEQAVPINLGASIGTCITAILGSLSLNREAKRSAYVHVLFQTIGVAIAFVLLSIPFAGGRLYIEMAKWMASLVSGSREDLPRQIAMAHTLMPIVNHIVIIPLLPLIAAAFDRLVPPAPQKEAFGPEFLSEAMLSEPSVALYQVKKELLRMAAIAAEMLAASERLLSSRDPAAKKAIRSDDDKVDILRREIVAYLAKLAKRSLSGREGKAQVSYLFIANELENLADVIEQNVLERAKKLINKDLRFSDEGLEDVASLYALVSGNLRSVLSAFENDDADLARAVLAEADRSSRLQRELRGKHFRRLNEGHKTSEETTEIHMDLLGDLNRINRHVYHVAQALEEMAEAPKDS